MTYDINKIKLNLDNELSAGPVGHSPITAKILKDPKSKLYSVDFSDKSDLTKYRSFDLTAMESFEVADQATEHLKTQGYACSVDLGQLPDEYKSGLGIKK